MFAGIMLRANRGRKRRSARRNYGVHKRDGSKLTNLAPGDRMYPFYLKGYEHGREGHTDRTLMASKTQKGQAYRMGHKDASGARYHSQNVAWESSSDYHTRYNPGRVGRTHHGARRNGRLGRTRFGTRRNRGGLGTAIPAQLSRWNKSAGGYYVRFTDTAGRPYTASVLSRASGWAAKIASKAGEKWVGPGGRLLMTTYAPPVFETAKRAIGAIATCLAVVRNNRGAGAKKRTSTGRADAWESRMKLVGTKAFKAGFSAAENGQPMRGTSKAYRLGYKEGQAFLAHAMRTFNNPRRGRRRGRR